MEEFIGTCECFSGIGKNLWNRLIINFVQNIEITYEVENYVCYERFGADG